MKCPLCNAEIPDGSLYCEVCGEDVHIVPDFDPTIDDAVRVTIESISREFFDNDQEKSHYQNFDTFDLKETSASVKEQRKDSSHTQLSDGYQNDDSQEINQQEYVKPQKRIKPIAFIITGVVFLALCICIPLLCVKLTSFDYKLAKADKYCQDLKFDRAAKVYEGLLEKDKYNIVVLEKYALALYGCGDVYKYERVLLEIVDSSYSTDEQKLSAYAKLVGFYANRNEYNAIKELILASGNQTIIEGYSDYLVDVPVITTKDGKYDLPQLLIIEADEDLEIRYSIINSHNGTEVVVADDLIYEGPVLLEEGVNEISAYCINENSVISDTVYGSVEIRYLPPSEPTIFPMSGAYFDGRYLEVVGYDSTNVTVYYTDDGSSPGVKSKVYKEMFVLLPGEWHYKFICVDEHGLCSKVVEANYIIDIPCEIDFESAKTNVYTYMFDTGVTVDPSGTLGDGGQLNIKLIRIDPIGENFAYVFEEFVYDGSDYSYLGVYYYVDMITGIVTKSE